MNERLKHISVIWVGSEEGGSGLLEACRREGAYVERQPLIVFAPPRDSGALARILDDLERFSWVVFTSAQAVRAMGDAQRPEAKIAAVGPSTRDALIARGWDVDLVPGRHDSIGLVMEFKTISRSEKPVLFVRGDRAKRTLPEGLTAFGFRVLEVEAYATREVDALRAREVVQRIAEKADVVIAGSPSGVETLENVVGAGRLWTVGNRLLWVCLGESTFSALRKAGVADAVFPDSVTAESVVDAIARARRPRP